MKASLFFSSNITLESEINIYRRLLDSETKRLAQPPIEQVITPEPAPPSFGSELGKVFNKKIKKGPIAISTYCHPLSQILFCSSTFHLETYKTLVSPGKSPRLNLDFIYSFSSSSSIDKNFSLLQRIVRPMANASPWKTVQSIRMWMFPIGPWNVVWKVHQKSPTQFRSAWQWNMGVNWKSSPVAHKTLTIDRPCKS